MVIDILRGIESHALQVRDMPNIPVSTELDAPSPAIRLPLERPLYASVEKTRIESEQVRNAEEKTNPAALFEGASGIGLETAYARRRRRRAAGCLSRALTAPTVAVQSGTTAMELAANRPGG